MPALPFLIFMYLSECLIVYSYANSIYKTRNQFSILISICLYAVLMSVYAFVTSQEIFNILFTLICNILCIYTCFKSSFKSSLFHGTILSIIQFVSEVASIYLISHISETPNNSYTENTTIYMIDVLISKVLYFTISRFLAKLATKEDSAKSWGRWCSLAILPVSSLFLIFVIRIITNGLIFSLVESIICIISIILLLVANIVVYIIYERAEKNNQKLLELELTNQKNDIDMQYLSLIEKKNETMNIMAHDYKNHMIAISNMSDQVEIKNYIDSMMGEIAKYNQICKTKNRLLDVILNKYIDICREKSIEFETSILTDNLNFISNYDISALFNNLLDNAVEASSKSAVKFINLEITNSLNSYHKITIINSSDNQPNGKKGNLITTKNNKATHGFGTKSIRKIVKKYHGEMNWEYDNSNKQFRLIILFPNEQYNK